jgi:uroporphyrinogen-III decarboxylase
MMEMVAQRPELVRYACDRYLSYCLRRVQQSACLGAAGIWIEDCMTDMISPAAFAELNLPCLRAIVNAIRSLGMHSIHYYCGDPQDRMDLLLSTGADALALEESKKGFRIDIADVAEFVQGRCALFGNLDAIHLLPDANEADLRDEITRQVAAGRRNKNRFVISLGSPVTPGTTANRVREYCQWAREISGTGSG